MYFNGKYEIIFNLYIYIYYVHCIMYIYAYFQEYNF